MDFETFLQHAHHLARTCTHLVECEPPTFPEAVWCDGKLVVASTFLPIDVGDSGLTISVSGADSCAGSASPCNFSEWLRDESAIPLCGLKKTSLPPIEAVFKFGDSDIQSWLKDVGWEPTWGYNSNFPVPEITERYDAAYQENCPLYLSGVYAVIGGWHFPWPDDDWDERCADELLLWTIRDADPWVEVWNSDGELRVIQRVT